MAGRLQITLALLKPDLVMRPVSAKAVREMIIGDGFYIVRSAIIRLSVPEAERFYEEHKGMLVCHVLRPSLLVSVFMWCWERD